MNDDQYLTYCQGVMINFATDLEKWTQTLDDTDSLRELALEFAESAASSDRIYGEGPSLVTRLFTTYPDFAPSFPRDLLWFLGGECLHFMPDDEIEQHQQLDEMRREAASRGAQLDFIAARAKLLKLQ
jgi:hypothetical protein